MCKEITLEQYLKVLEGQLKELAFDGMLVANNIPVEVDVLVEIALTEDLEYVTADTEYDLIIKHKNGTLFNIEQF